MAITPAKLKPAKVKRISYKTHVRADGKPKIGKSR